MKYPELHGVQCPKCKQILISMSTHDFRICDCDFGCFVDGGQDPDGYRRVGGKDLSKIKNVKVIFDERKAKKGSRPRNKSSKKRKS